MNNAMEDYKTSFENIKELISMSVELYDRAYCLYAPEVELIISKPIVSSEPVECLLDNLLAFCEDKRCLELYKRVCWHLYRFYPDSALFYANLCIENYLEDIS